MDKIWELRVPAHVGGDECYFESYIAAVGTKDEALILAREHGYAPEHIAMRQTDNVWGLKPGAFRPVQRLASQQPSSAPRYRKPSMSSAFRLDAWIAAISVSGSLIENVAGGLIENLVF